jgi:hypothetical protein
MMVPGESSYGEFSHNPTGFPEEVKHGIQTFHIEFSAEIHTVGIIWFASHRDTGGEFSVEFPRTLSILVRELAAELDKAKIEGEGAFGEGRHGLCFLSRFSHHLPEVSEQSLKRSLIRLVVFPMGEVTDMAGTFNLTCPSSVCIINCVINLDRKQDRSAILALAFFLECRFDFIFDPITFHRSSRKYDKEFVALPYRLVDGIADTITDLHVLGRKPTLHSFILEIIAEPFGEILVFARMTDKAGEELNGLSNECPQMSSCIQSILQFFKQPTVSMIALWVRLQ